MDLDTSPLPERMGRRSVDSSIPKSQPALELVDCSKPRSNLQPPGNPEERSRESKTKPAINLQLAVLYYTIFMLGFQDGSLGPLLPVIQRVYHVDFTVKGPTFVTTVVSLIFVFSCFGLLVGALINIQPGHKLGFGKTILIGAICQSLGYCLLSPGPPFNVIILAYTIIGVGESMQNVQANAFVAALGSNTKLGFLHASYGTGAFVSPLIATQFSQISHWSFHWLVALGLSMLNVVLLACVFRMKHRCELVDEPYVSNSESTTSQSNRWKEILRLRAVHSLAFFIMVYCGVEVTLGGWIVTFIIKERHGSSSAGYVSSGFFGGLMVGRLALLWVNKKIGTRRVIFAYALLSLSLEFIIWFTPNLIGDAIAVSFVGVLMGPMFPLIMNYAHLLLPPSLLVGSLGWIVGGGTTGICFLPFIQGGLANRFGIGSLQPFVIAMMGLLIVLWSVVPTLQRHVE